MAAVTVSRMALAGMRDNACGERVIAALSRISGVTEVGVSLIRACAEVDHGRGCQAARPAGAVAATGCVARVTDERGSTLKDLKRTVARTRGRRTRTVRRKQP